MNDKFKGMWNPPKTNREVANVHESIIANIRSHRRWAKTMNGKERADVIASTKFMAAGAHKFRVPFEQRGA